jgi:uroporphyrinogen decarboxylase
MTSKVRFLTALERGIPDRLPVTTHHVMPYFLDTYMDGISSDKFFEIMGLDPIVWTVPHKPEEVAGQYYDPDQERLGFLESRRITTDNWRISCEEIADSEYKTVSYSFHTPKRTLTMMLRSGSHTAWIAEYLIKEKRDIDLIAEYGTTPKCDVAAVNKTAAAYGNKALIRGHICGFDVYGQPGCWQDACCLVGTERMIMETFDDPQWVHELLAILQKRKLGFACSLKGAKYDLIELGGGDASSTVISPQIFNDFVAPYDSVIIEIAHQAGQRIVYHICGGMMPILEDIVAMKPDAMETFTPATMGGDVDLFAAKQRIGDRVCIIGGFDQFHYLKGCSAEETRNAVRTCFEQAGVNGGYILATSDHFFDAEVDLIKTYADEACRCTY